MSDGYKAYLREIDRLFVKPARAAVRVPKPTHPRDLERMLPRDRQSTWMRIGKTSFPICRRRGDILWWPQLAITRTALGTAKNKTSSDAVISFGAVVTAGDFLVAICAFDVMGNVYYAWDGSTGLAFTQKTEAINVGNVETAIFSVFADITANASGSVICTGSAAKAVVLIKISGVAAVPFDKSSVGTGSGTSPSSGATAVLAQADEICIGAVGTEGPVEDAAGTWSNSFNAGQRDGTTGSGATSNITVSEGYLIVSATTAQTAAKTGITSRDWAAAITTYKAAADEAFPPFQRPLPIPMASILAQ